MLSLFLRGSFCEAGMAHLGKLVTRFNFCYRVRVLASIVNRLHWGDAHTNCKHRRRPHLEEKNEQVTPSSSSHPCWLTLIYGVQDPRVKSDSRITAPASQSQYRRLSLVLKDNSLYQLHFSFGDYISITIPLNYDCSIFKHHLLYSHNAKYPITFYLNFLLYHY